MTRAGVMAGLLSLVLAGVACEKAPPPPPKEPAVKAPAPPPAPEARPKLAPTGDHSALDPFASSSAIHALGLVARAKDAAGARAVAAGIGRLIKAGGGRLLTPGLVSIQVPRTPVELLSALKVRRARSIRSLEAALLLVTALREAGYTARLAEVDRLADGSMPDQGGSTGLFVAAVLPAPGSNVKEPMYLTPAGAAFTGDVRPLHDDTARALFLLETARARLSWDAKAGANARDLLAAADALRAAEDTATVLASKALLLAALGDGRWAEFEATRAAKVRNDAPRGFVVSRALAAAGKQAESDIALAMSLSRGPTVPALEAKGAFELASGQLAKGRQSVAAARVVGPGAPGTLMLEALLAQKDGQLPAMEKALAAMVAADPDDIERRVSAYHILRTAGKTAAADKLRKDSEQSALFPALARVRFGGPAAAPAASPEAAPATGPVGPAAPGAPAGKRGPAAPGRVK